MELVIFSEKVDGRTKRGLKETVNNNIVIDCLYDFIDIRKHYSDLTTLNYSEVFVLYNNNQPKIFCFCEEERAPYLSKESYSEVAFFYKNMAFCTQQGKMLIIDKKENIYFESEESDPSIFFTNICNSYAANSLKTDLGQQLFFEMNRLFEMHNKFWMYGDIDENIGIEINTSNNNEVLCRESYILMPIEEELGLSIETGINIYSIEFQKLMGDYNPFTGNWLVKKDNGKFAFINKYMYQVGEDFDMMIVIDSYLNKMIPETIKDQFTIIGNEGELFIIRFTGDFIYESIYAQDLFCEYQTTKDLIRKYRDLKFQDEKELPNRSYWKFDKAIVEQSRKEKLLDNPNFEFTENWENDIIVNNVFNIIWHPHRNFEYYIPFHSNNLADLDIKRKIEDLNHLVGVVYSSYEIIGKIGTCKASMDYKYDDELVKSIFNTL